MGLHVAFAGTPRLAATILQSLLDANVHQVSAVFTQPDRPAGRGRRLQPGPVTKLALAHRLPLYQPHSAVDIPVSGILDRSDVMLVVAYGVLLPPAVLAAPRLGCINVHLSLLPRWRGAAPVQHALLAGDSETGITIMQMDRGLDTGAILLQQSCPIRVDDTCGSLQERLAGLGADLAGGALEAIAAGGLTPRPQDDGAATHAGKISKEDARIDWTMTAADIARRIRAFNPAPVAHGQLEGVEMRIWEAVAPGAKSMPGAKPGTINNLSADGLFVNTGRDILQITRLQFPGKGIVSARDVCNASPWKRGAG